MKIIAAFAVGLALAGSFSAAPAIAQNNRSFVSGQGLDSNTCALAAPCRTFQRAHDMTNANGEIAVLDTAGYGTVIITKAISIIAPDGIEAGVTVGSTQPAGIYINNSQLSDSVTLRGLTISGGGIATYGIYFLSGGELIVKNCVVTGFAFGTQVLAGAPAGSGITTIVTDTVISNNSSYGIYFDPNGGGGSLSFERLQFLGNNTGFTVDGRDGTLVKAAGSDSFAAGNATGFEAYGGANLMLDNVKSVNNGKGVLSSNGASMTLSRSVLYGNTTLGYEVDPNSFISTLGDNRILQSNNQGTLTSKTSSIQ